MTDTTRCGLDAILHPSSVAVVGVSENRGSPGSLIYRAIRGMGFEGELYPVNRRGRHGNGEPCFHALADIPGSIDLVFLATAPDAVPALVRECAALGVKGCVINSAGFSETGSSEGRRLDDELRHALKDSPMRIIGPNCLGIYSSEGRVAFFDNMKPGPGGISMLSQSGSVSTFSYYLAGERNLHFSTIVSSGNELDVNCAELLEYFIEDPHTSVILAYLEELREPRRFMELAARAHGTKPIIACKSGLSESGKRAAMSHTGALGGSLAVWQGAATQSRIVLADDLSDLLDLGAIFRHLPKPRGRNVGILSSPGGLAVIAADLAERYGLKVPQLSEATAARLADILPGQGISTANPVDLGFGALKEGVYEEALRILEEDESIDLLVALGGAPSSREGDPLMFHYFSETITHAKKALTKPLLVLLLSTFHMDACAARLYQAGIPSFGSISAGLKAFARFVDYYL